MAAVMTGAAKEEPPRCDRCRFWGDAFDASNAQPTEPRDCNRIDHDGYGPKPVLAYTLDASGFESSLITYPDFGCVQYEAGEPGDYDNEIETKDEP